MAACAVMGVEAQSLKVLKGTDHSWDALGMSGNHRYVAGAADYNSGCFVWDTETGDVSYIASEETELRGVSNDGIGVGFAYPEPNQAVTFNPVDKKLSILEIPTGCQGLANAVTPDGKMIVGLTYDAGYNSKPCFWLDGKYHELSVPTDEQAGLEVNGARAEDVSADGSVILGTVIDNFSVLPPIVWVRNDQGEYVLDCVAKGLLADDPYEENPTQPYSYITTGGISPNGQWICLTLQGTDFATPQLMGRMNLSTKAITVAQDLANGTEFQKSIATLNEYAAGISDDGTVVGYTASMPWDTQRAPRTALIMKPSDKAPNSLSAMYCTEQFKAIEANGNTLINISADGNYLQGYVIGDNGNNSAYLLSLVDSGVEEMTAAEDVATEIYNLQGVKVGSETSGLTHGVYLVKKGHKTTKVCL